MPSINSVILVGRLTKDPELKVTPTGKKVTSFTLAIDKRGKDAGANFIDCHAWEQKAEYLSKYAKKGALVNVCGRLDQRVWEKDGRQNSKIEVIADEVQILSSVKVREEQSDEGWRDGHTPTANDYHKQVEEPIELSDIPF